MRAKRTVAVLVAVLAYYVFVIGHRAVVLVRDDRWQFRGLGVALLVLPVLGALFVVAEVRFGIETQRLARLAGDVGDVADFDAVAVDAEAAPEDWRAWYRLALAYDAGRDSRRGRAAMRKAIALERAATR